MNDSSMTTAATSHKISQNAMAHLLMLAVVMLWGAMFVLIKVAMDVISPQWFNAIRMMIAFVCLALIYRKEFRRLTREAWIFGAAAGASLALGYVFQTQGLVYTTATNSAFITALVVVIVPILASIPGIAATGSRFAGVDGVGWRAGGAVGGRAADFAGECAMDDVVYRGRKRRCGEFADLVLRGRVFALCHRTGACIWKGTV